MSITLPFTTLVAFFLVKTVLTACLKGETNMSSENTMDCGTVVLTFTRLLADREYDKAYSMTSQEYRNDTSAEQLRIAFEEILPIGAPRTY